MGRLTRDPDIRYSQGENAQAVARYTLAVDRRFRRQDGEQQADFISCVAFGRSAEFAEKYLHQGTKIVVSGRIQTGSYTRNDGTKVYTTDVVVEDQEFAESKGASERNAASGQGSSYRPSYGTENAPWQSPAGGKPVSADRGQEVTADGFMNIPDGIDEELPFH